MSIGESAVAALRRVFNGTDTLAIKNVGAASGSTGTDKRDWQGIIAAVVDSDGTIRTVT